MMYWYGPGMSGWGAGTMLASTVFFWLVLIAAAVLLFRLLRERAGHDRQRGTAAEHVLAERFARGEIDEEEYRHRLDILRRT